MNSAHLVVSDKAISSHLDAITLSGGVVDIAYHCVGDFELHMEIEALEFSLVAVNLSSLVPGENYSELAIQQLAHKWNLDVRGLPWQVEKLSL